MIENVTASRLLAFTLQTTFPIITNTTHCFALREENITKIAKEILAIDVQDGIDFVFEGIREIRESDEYENYRISFSAHYGKINNPMKIDITTGDAITPREMIYEYPLMFDEGHIKVMAYPLETILAEKIETIVRRNIATTRMRDFYDVYLLYKLYENKINFKTLARAIENTSKKRESLDDIADCKEILVDIENDDYLK